MTAKLGVLAGRGRLVGAVIKAARERDRDVFVLAFEGETDPAVVTGLPHAWVALGSVGRAIGLLHDAAVDEVVMIGAIDRPSFAGMKVDFRGMKLLAKLGLQTGRGDNSLLSIVANELEEEGFRVLGADQLIEPMLAPLGVMTRVEPSEADERDIALGIEVASTLGALDVGQAVVVQQGLVLAVEAIEGTDALLVRARALRRDGPGGVLVKMKKPGQDRRADLPTIGDQTVAGAITAGLRGVAVHAGHCLIVERTRALDLADDAGLFVVGITGPG